MRGKPLLERRDPSVIDLQVCAPGAIRETMRLALQSGDYKTKEEIVLEALALWRERCQADLRELAFLHGRLGTFIAIGQTSSKTAQDLRVRAEEILRRPAAAMETKE